jgi:tetratricopeptide (TPR) repeat protein
MPTVTLSVIVKDEVNDVDRLIHDSVDHFDELHFAIDDQKVFDDLVESYKFNPKIKFFKYEWIDDFAHKRNFLVSKVTTDFYFTVDTDDTILNPDMVLKVAERAEKNGYAIVYGFYIYSTDADGNTNASHWKERLVKNTPKLKWNKKIHENIVPVGATKFNFDLDDRLLVKHNKSFEGIAESNKRNLKFLVDEWNQDKENTDPRTIAYLGRVFLGLGDFKKARFFLEKHIALSGWDEDRYLSWCQLSTLHRLTKDYNQAIACAFEALTEKPEFPDAYLSLHDVYFDQEQWTKAIEWGEQGLKKEPPKNFIVVDPSAYTWRPAASLSYCYWNLGQYEKALKLFNFAKNLAPSVPFIKENEHIYLEGVERADYIDHLLWMVKFTNDNNKDKVKDLVNSIPEKFFENQTISLIRNKFLEPKTWVNNSIVIYCGEGVPEPWNPNSIDKGIGGSEEAVIQMSKELVKLGFAVTVYNNCGTEGIYDGVQYLNHIRLNPRDQFNILIGWRCNPFAYGMKAKKRIIWLHDIPHFIFQKEDVKNFDKIIVLSEYHKSLLSEIVPDEKIYISTNGLVPGDFSDLGVIKREPHRIIYASSYDRGLETILDSWKEIRAACPDAEIHCYYGWNTYDALVTRDSYKDGGWKQHMMDLMSQEGVFEHGRIGHKELLVEYAKSSIFAYPCKMAGEINCLALSKAIACGCYPLTNDFAVLPERNTYGKVVKDDKFISSLITLLRKGDTKIKNTGFIEANSWEKVAQDWKKDIL